MRKYTPALPEANCDGGMKPTSRAAREAAKPTPHNPTSSGARYPRGWSGCLCRSCTAATNISRYMIRYTCVVITEKIQ